MKNTQTPEEIAADVQKWMADNPRTRPAPKPPEKGKLTPYLLHMQAMKAAGRSLGDIADFLMTKGVEATRSGIHLSLAKEEKRAAK